jgi:hypothetical protein
MIAVLILFAGTVVALGYALSRATAAPAARRVSISERFAQARLITAESAGRRPGEQPLHGTRGEPRRHQPRSYVAHCNSGAALGLRHSRRP